VFSGVVGRAPSAVGSPAAIAITPDGKTAWVADLSAATVTPVTLATNAVGSTIAVGTSPDAIAITPDGVTAYVTDNGSAKVTPITWPPRPRARPSRSAPPRTRWPSSELLTLGVFKVARDRAAAPRPALAGPGGGA
jgi:DNA-binding beta-propeller fold protein YncE